MLQFDVGTCVEMGSDPVAWINANPGRINSLHLKDWNKEKGYRVLFGEGAVPWKQVFAAAEKTGGVEYYLIEQEGSDYPEFETAQRCLDTYKQLRRLTLTSATSDPSAITSASSSIRKASIAAPASPTASIAAENNSAVAQDHALRPRARRAGAALRLRHRLREARYPARLLGARRSARMPAAPPLDELPLATAVPAAAAAARRLHVRGLSAIPTAASARATSSASPPPCNASRPPWITPSRRIRDGTAAALPQRRRRGRHHPHLRLRRGHRRARRRRSHPHPPQHRPATPNIGGTPLVVSLGCEKMQPARLFSIATCPSSTTTDVIRLQDERGFGEIVARHPARRREAAAELEPPHAASPVPRPIWSSACNAAAATPSPASPAIPPWASRPTCWCAPAPP